MSIILAAAAAAAASAQPSEFNKLEKIAQSQVCNAANMNSSTLEHLHTIPTDDFLVAPLGQQPFVEAASNSGEILGYTRLRVDYFSCAGENRNISNERRGFLRQWLMGKHVNHAFELEIHIQPFDVKWNGPLVNVQRDSTTQGENFDSTVDNGDFPLAYVRVDSGMTALLKAKVKMTRNYEAHAAGNSIALLLKATSLIAPHAGLVTTLNQQRFNDAANFVDTTLSGLLAVTVAETATRTVPFREADGDQLLSVYGVYLPFANDVYASKAHNLFPVGAWVVVAEKYRASMFGNVSSGKLSAERLSPAAILAFDVGDKKAVREALAASDTIGKARDELVKSEPKGPIGEKAYALCRLISAAGEAIRLTPIDSAAVAWAYIKDLGMAQGYEKAALDGCSRIEHFPT